MNQRKNELINESMNQPTNQSTINQSKLIVRIKYEDLDIT